MLRQLLVGSAVSVCNIAIHGLVMATVVRYRRIHRVAAIDQPVPGCGFRPLHAPAEARASP